MNTRRPSRPLPAGLQSPVGMAFDGLQAAEEHERQMLELVIYAATPDNIKAWKNACLAVNQMRRVVAIAQRDEIVHIVEEVRALVLRLEETITLLHATQPAPEDSHAKDDPPLP